MCATSRETRTSGTTGAATDEADAAGPDLPRARDRQKEPRAQDISRAIVLEPMAYKARLLGDLPVTWPDRVWCTDITCIPMRRGVLYLVAITDWHSRKVPSWRLSTRSA